MDLIWFVIDWSWTVGAPYLRLALVFSDLLINETSWGSTVTIFRNGIKIIEYRKIMQHYTNLHDIQTQRRWFLYERVTSWGSLLTNPCSKPFIVTAPECCTLWHLSSVDCTPSTTPEGNPALGGNPAPEKNPANKGNVEGSAPPTQAPSHQQSEFRTGGAGGSGRATSTHTGATGNGWQLIWYAPSFHIRNKPGEPCTLKEAHLF